MVKYSTIIVSNLSLHTALRSPKEQRCVVDPPENVINRLIAHYFYLEIKFIYFTKTTNIPHHITPSQKCRAEESVQTKITID